MVRVLTTVGLCSLVMLAAGWSHGAALSPPKCSDAGSKGVETGWLPGHRLVSVAAPAPTTSGGAPTYTRMCGPASAVVRFQGRSFAISGGRCALNGKRDYVVQVGLTAAPPAAPGRSLDLVVGGPTATTVGGVFTMRSTWVVAKIQVSNNRSLDVSGGTVSIDPSRRGGTFAFRLRDATRVSGRWICG